MSKHILIDKYGIHHCSGSYYFTEELIMPSGVDQSSNMRGDGHVSYDNITNTFYVASGNGWMSLLMAE